MPHIKMYFEQKDTAQMSILWESQLLENRENTETSSSRKLKKTDSTLHGWVTQ